jgi:hypothetical protein
MANFMETESEDEFYFENNNSQRACFTKKRAGIVGGTVIVLLLAGAVVLAYNTRSHLPVNADVSAVTMEAEKAAEWEYRFTTVSDRQGEALSDLPTKWLVSDYEICDKQYKFFKANTGSECAKKCHEIGCKQFSFQMTKDMRGCRLGTGPGGKCVTKNMLGTGPGGQCRLGSREHVGNKMFGGRRKTNIKTGWSECTVLTYALFREEKKNGWCSPYKGTAGNLCKEQPKLKACNKVDRWKNYLNECVGDFECVSKLCSDEPKCVGFTQKKSNGKYKLKSKIDGVTSHRRYRCFVAIQ